MKRTSLILFGFLVLACFPSLSNGKELPKIAVWDLDPVNTPPAHARQLTSFVVSEITKLKKYEVYSQENVRTLAGWTADRMQLGCTDTKCLTALGQMDIAKLISGSVGKIGKRYTVSLNLFDTQNARAENAISKTSESEDELIELIQASVRELLGESPAPSAKTAPGEYRDSVTGMEFVLVKGGCFHMGDLFGEGADDEKPIHEACVNDFYMGKYEVTVGEFKKFAADTAYTTDAEKGDGCFIFTGREWRKDTHKNWRNPGFPQNDRHPVVCVSWADAAAFIQWLSRKSGRGYRLPTEAEWEYAARSGGKRYKYSWGDGDPSANMADESLRRNFPKAKIEAVWRGYSDGYVFTAPVGNYRPNELGLHDMTGNVWEMMSDWYDKDYYVNSPKNNPTGPGSGQYRGLRGGSWYDGSWLVRASARHRDNPSVWASSYGFRLVGFSK